MFPEHNATLPTHLTKLPHAEARVIDQALLRCTKSQLYHLAMLSAYSMAYILAGNQRDASPEYRLDLLQLHLDYLRLSRQQWLCESIDRLSEVFGRSQ